MRRTQKIIEVSHWYIRLALSIIVLTGFLLAFFLGGGINYFKPAISVTNFSNNDFEIHFIDVGLGDSILIRFPDKRTMLVDCGPNYSSNTVTSYISDFFEREHITQIDYFVLTHQDADHVGKGVDIFNKFEVKNVYRPKILSKSEIATDQTANYKVSTTATYDNVIKAMYSEPDCNVYYTTAGTEFYDINLKIEFLSPEQDVYSNMNNYSPMIMVTYSDCKFLLTGDGESIAENEVISKYGDALKADVLKVGHHGSSTSSSDKFLSYVQPRYAVISVSNNNRYQFPKTETLSRLNSVNARILTTANSGTIAMTVNPNGQLVMAFSGDIFKIDLPVLVVVTALGLIIIWGVKVKRKPKKSQI